MLKDMRAAHDPDATLVPMSNVTEAGVQAVKDAACDVLLQARVDRRRAAAGGSRLRDKLTRLVATPGRRGAKATGISDGAADGRRRGPRAEHPRVRLSGAKGEEIGETRGPGRAGRGSIGARRSGSERRRPRLYYRCGSTSRTRGPASEADCERRGGGASRDRETASNDGTGTHVGGRRPRRLQRRNVARVHRPAATATSSPRISSPKSWTAKTCSTSSTRMSSRCWTSSTKRISCLG